MTATMGRPRTAEADPDQEKGELPRWASTCTACGRWTREPDPQGRCGVCASGGWLPSEAKDLAFGEEEKTCSSCHETRPAAAFPWESIYRKTRRGTCLFCKAAKARALRAAGKNW